MMLLIRRLPGLLYVHKHTVYVTILLLITVMYMLHRWNIICTNLEAWHHIQKACDFYKKETALGTLCNPLCNSDEMNSLICHSLHATKEAVFSIKWHDTRVVFKSASTDIQALHWFDNGFIKYPTEREFLSTIRAIARNKLNISLPQDALARISHLKSSYEENNLERRRIEMDNLWILLQDNEYLVSSVYTDKDVFPQVLGTCGSYFAVEYMDPVKTNYALFSTSDSREDWGKNIKTAALIIELLEELENVFGEPVHLCDIKLDHFGFTNGGAKIKFLDLDYVFPKSIISKIIRETGECTRDEDCEFFDCRSRCDPEIGNCEPLVSNNNLQIVCEKIFLGWRMSNTIIIPGLLMSEHTPTELASVIRQCANPENEPGKPRGAPDEELRKRLYDILTEIEQSVNVEEPLV